MAKTLLRRASASLWLLAATSLPSPAIGGEPFQLLRMGQLYCPAKHLPAIETIVDAPSKPEQRSAVERAMFGGACSVSPTDAMQIGSVTQGKTVRGGNFSCFQVLNAVDQRDVGRYCSASSSVTSLDDELSTRTGDYRVINESASLIKAKCVEGGTLMIFKKQEQWERMSLVFPKALDPLTHSIPADRERALRDGCKGADYR